MEIEQALDVLRRFQNWRTGRDCRTMMDAEVNPHDVTEALDTVQTHFGKPVSEPSCLDCKHQTKLVGCDLNVVGKCNRYQPKVSRKVSRKVSSNGK